MYKKRSLESTKCLSCIEEARCLKVNNSSGKFHLLKCRLNSTNAYYEASTATQIKHTQKKQCKYPKPKH